LPWARRGALLARLGQGADALAAFDEALARDPSDPQAPAGRAAVELQLQSAAVAALAASAVIPPPQPDRKRLPVSLVAALIMLPYLIGLTIAELAVTFVSPVLVFPLHGGLAAVVATQLALVTRLGGRDPGFAALRPFLITLVLAPLIRIISLTLPLAQIAPAYRYAFAGVPMALGAILTAVAIGYGPRRIGLIWRATGWQFFAVAISIGLGFAEFAILRPQALGPFPWTTAGLVPALSVGLATGLPEELIFRGVMQTAARPVLRGWNWIFVSMVFAVLHIGYASPLDFVFVLGVGLLYGWLFERTRSIIGVAIGHGVANIVLFFVAPQLMG